jgi:nucleotide-binding universal stress UspA family protein
VANRGADLVRLTWPDLDVEPVGRVDLPAPILIAASQAADLIVVGTRGRNPLAEMALGSVAERVAGHGHCPVVVVHRHAAAPPGPDHPVLVGVDNSPRARQALDLAARWAHEAAAPLSVICAWTVADAVGDAGLTPGHGSRAEDAAHAAARRAVDAAVGRVLERHPDLQVTGSTRVGVPSQVLAQMAAGAGLLVVGSRGRGALGGLLLGSVSHAIVRTAPCAVAVVGEHAHPLDADPTLEQQPQAAPSMPAP